jgi:hypothetical protein
MSLGHTHAPMLQVACQGMVPPPNVVNPLGHVLPQLPQLNRSFRRSRHVWEQQALGEQHWPPQQISPWPQHLPPQHS